MKTAAIATGLIMLAGKAAANANCDCLEERCVTQMSVCNTDDECLELIDCACNCPSYEADCALACVAPHMGNPAALGVGICGGNEGCWTLVPPDATTKKLRGAGLPLPWTSA